MLGFSVIILYYRCWSSVFSLCTTDAGVLTDVETMKAKVTALKTKLIGRSNVYLSGEHNVCCVMECNLGRSLPALKRHL